MQHRCIVTIQNSELDRHFDVIFEVPDGEELHPLDTGQITMKAVAPHRLVFETLGFKKAGYEIVIRNKARFSASLELQLEVFSQCVS